MEGCEATGTAFLDRRNLPHVKWVPGGKNALGGGINEIGGLSSSEWPRDGGCSWKSLLMPLRKLKVVHKWGFRKTGKERGLWSRETVLSGRGFWGDSQDVRAEVTLPRGDTKGNWGGAIMSIVILGGLGRIFWGQS